MVHGSRGTMACVVNTVCGTHHERHLLLVPGRALRQGGLCPLLCQHQDQPAQWQHCSKDARQNHTGAILHTTYIREDGAALHVCCKDCSWRATGHHVRGDTNWPYYSRKNSWQPAPTGGGCSAAKRAKQHLTAVPAATYWCYLLFHGARLLCRWGPLDCE